MRGVPRLRRAISRAPVGFDGHAEDAGRAVDDELEVVLAVEVEAVDDAEAAAQGRGEKARAGGGGHQGEGLQGDLHGAGARTGADHEVEAAVLEGGIEDLLDLGVEAVDLVHEEDLARLEGGEEGGEVAGALDDGAGGGLDGDARARRR